MRKLTKLLNNWSGTALELFGELNFLTHWKKKFEELETKVEEDLEGEEEDFSLLGVSKDSFMHLWFWHIRLSVGDSDNG